jgi:hypothetical protein
MMIPPSARLPAAVAAAATLCAGCAGESGAAPAAGRLTPLPSSAAFTALDYRAGDLFAIDARGRLLLSDADAAQVIVYSREGSEETRLGRKGAGPGEQILPHGAAVGEDGSLVVVDAGLQRLSHFDAGHRLVSTHPVPGTPLQVLSWDGRQVLMVWFEGTSTGPVVGRIDVTTGKAEALYRPYERAPELAAKSPGSAAGPVQPWVAAAFAPDGRVLIARPEAYRIFAFDAATGSVRQSFGRTDVERERPSEREAAESEEKLKRIFETSGLPLTPELLTEARDRPKPFFLMHSFAADGDGRLWIATQRGAYGETQLDLFGADGTFLRTLAVRDRVLRIAVSGPYLAVLVERQSGASEGAEGVDVYRVDTLP